MKYPACFLTCCVVFQYMLNALRDCVPILIQVRHESSPQVMLESFEKEIEDALNEVRTAVENSSIKKDFSIEKG